MLDTLVVMWSSVVMLSFDDRQIKRLTADLKTFADKAYPFATRNTLNVAAFDTQNVARVKVRQRMILRNTNTIRSIQVEKATGLRVNDQMALVGSTEEYMEQQEFGSIREAKPITTSYSAGQMGREPRTRLARPKNKMANIRLRSSRKKGKSRRQRNLIAIREAAKSGRSFVYLELQRTKGIFKVVGGKKNPKIRMVHDMSRKTVVVPRNPWLRPAVQVVEKRIHVIHRKSLEFQAKRHGLFEG